MIWHFLDVENRVEELNIKFLVKEEQKNKENIKKAKQKEKKNIDIWKKCCVATGCDGLKKKKERGR